MGPARRDASSAETGARRVVGVISDTHGLLRPEAIEALRGADLILHAGDIGDAEIVARLGNLAPTVAVRGNVDVEPWARAFPVSRTVEVEGRKIHLLHAIEDLHAGPRLRGVEAIVCGHSHHPSVESRSGVLYVNAGSAGPRRFRLPVSLAILTVSEEGIEARIVELHV